MRYTKHSHINFAAVLRVIGMLLTIEALFMLVPLVTCLAYGEDDVKAFGITVAVTLGVGCALAFGLRPSNPDMGKRDGFLLTALVWVFFSLFGMLPFMIGGAGMSVSDAFFEAMSGFTTTGASVIRSVDELSRGIVLWRSLMQWLGGMGIILFTLAVIPMLNHSGGMQMFNAEVTGITHDKLRPRISQTAKGLWSIYCVLTLLLALLLWVGPMDFYTALCYTFSTISTGGFTTTNAGIMEYGTLYVKVVLTVFMFLGGVSFSLMFRWWNGDHGSLWRNDVFRAYVRIILICLVLFIITIFAMGAYTGIQSVSIDPLFQIISTLTSTGFMVEGARNWGPFVISLLFVMMFFGSCAGSTSGGAKIDRMLFLIKNANNEVYRCVHPNTILGVRINGVTASYDTVNKVIAFLCIYMMLIVGGGIALTALDIPIVDAFFSSFACLSNTGLDVNITGYGDNYLALPDAGKWILSLEMLIGRLEIFTVLLLFTRGFWK